MFSDVKQQFNKLDIFVHNARPEAAEFFQPPMDITLGQWDAAFDSQVKAFLIAARLASDLMSDGGRILTITYAQGSRTAFLSRKPSRRASKLIAKVRLQLGHA